MLADFNQIERCLKKMKKKEEAVLILDQRKFKIVYTAWYGSCNFSDRMYSV
jgi:hypothetical protein